MTQERRKPIQGCVIELVTNVSNWDSTYWGAFQEMYRMHFITVCLRHRRERHVTTYPYPISIKD